MARRELLAEIQGWDLLRGSLSIVMVSLVEFRPAAYFCPGNSDRPTLSVYCRARRLLHDQLESGRAMLNMDVIH